MNNKRFPPLVIKVYGEQANEFIRHEPSLTKQGYSLESTQDIEQLFNQSELSDISIVNLTSLERSHRDSLVELSKPFLVYNFDDKFSFNADDLLLQKAVGYFVDRPSSKDISLKVELGLLLHEERRKINKRFIDINHKFEANRNIGVAIGLVMAHGDLPAQEAFEFLRNIARNKRCRVNDVSNALIINQTAEIKSQHKHFNNLSSIKQWLEENILINHDRE